jgi:hypothetical protein
LRGAAVALEQPPEAFVALDLAGALLAFLDRRVPDSLVWAIQIVMGGVFIDGPARRRLAEEDHLAQALGLDGEYEAFCVGVAVGGAIRRERGLRPGVLQRLLERGGVLGAAVADEEGVGALLPRLLGPTGGFLKNRSSNRRRASA